MALAVDPSIAGNSDNVRGMVAFNERRQGQLWNGVDNWRAAVWSTHRPDRNSWF
jgi:hypothetical protein